MTDASNIDRTLTGIGYMLTGVFSGVMLDICAKWLMEEYSVVQVVFLRSCFGFLFLLALAAIRGRLMWLRSSQPQWHLARSCLALVCTVTFFYALSKLPLADALTIAFAVPLVVTALSMPLLGEHVGKARWAAVLVGFGGVVIAMRPGPAMFQPALGALLISVLTYALLAITSRKLAFTESAESLATWIYPASIVALAWPTATRWIAPSPQEWGLFALTGLLSAIAFTCINAAYRHARASAVVPFEYSSLVWGVAAGYLIWNDTPDAWVITGATVIVSSGLFILYRESRTRVRPNTFPVQDIPSPGANPD